MGRFESYPSTEALNDNDITLYNHNNNTNKITFLSLVNLIKSKLESIGIISIDTGAGLVSDGTITSTGTIKCDLQSEVPASLQSETISTMTDRQYAVGLDANGHLSVNVPWEGGSSSYQAGSGINISNNVISTKLKSNTISSLYSTSMGSTSNRQYAVGLDGLGYLSVNIPWVEYTAEKGILLNNSTHKFSANLKSTTLSSLSSTSMGTTSNRQYAVGLDKDGYLSVNIPWSSGSSYSSGSGIDISNNSISVKLKSNTQSSLASNSMGTTSNRQYAVGLDSSGYLSVNIPWENTLPNNGSLTIKQNGTEKIIFTANQASSEEVDIITPTKLSELTNDSGYTTNVGTVTTIATGAGLTGGTITGSGTIKAKLKSETKSTLTAANKGSTSNREYAVGLDASGNLSVNVPWENNTYTVNNGTLTIQKNGTNVQTFTANQSSNVTANITVPTKLSELTNDSGYTTNVGTVTRVQTGVGLVGDITTSGTIKTKLKSETASTLSSASMGSTSNRQYAVGLDSSGYLSVNIPWENTTYTATNGVKLSGVSIRANLKSDTKSTLSSASMGTTSNRQYAVGLDNSGYLSVNIPWENTTYSANNGVKLTNGIFSADLKSNTQSSLASANITSVSNRQYAVQMDANGYLSVNVPWNDGNDCMLTNGSNADNHVTFNGSFTVGTRNTGTIGANSVAEGYHNIAQGRYSHAEGMETTASGHESHAEGDGTTASGNDSHAEGSSTIASGTNAHAEGYLCTASGNDSHAECVRTIASGHESHAEGHQTTASGDVSHAEGYVTTASGLGSHAEGYHTIANNSISHVEGRYTESKGDASHSEGYGYDITDIGSSTPPSEYDNTATNAIYSKGKGSHAEGCVSTYYVDASSTTVTGILQANGDGSHVEGYAGAGNSSGMIIASGNGSHAEGYVEEDEYNIASGLGSHAEGNQTTASGNYSHAEGHYCTASEYNAHAEGNGCEASGDSSHAEGMLTIASGQSSHAEGGSTQAIKDNSHAEGSSTIANGENSHAEGRQTTTSGINSHAEGSHTIASGVNSHAEGGYTTASGGNSHAEGRDTTASGNESFAGGYHATAVNDGSFVFGGVGNIFGQENKNGIFGICPSGQYFDNSTPIIDANQTVNGYGGSASSSVNALVLGLNLSNATYALFTSPLDSTPDLTIISCSSNNVTSLPFGNASNYVATFTNYMGIRAGVYIRPSVINKSVQFHLIRIM